jgi:hypothetical protein
MAVSRRFGDSEIWKEFEQTTLEMEQALEQDDDGAFRVAVRANHQLLVRSGVVPEAVQRCVETVEERGGAAKVCGAGAVRGEQAGVLLVVGEVPSVAECHALGYERLEVTAELEGARVIEDEHAS